MRHYRLVFIIATLISYLFPATFAAAQGPPPAKVRTVAVTETVRSENTGLIGVLYFDRVSRISTEVPGMVQEAFFSAGDRIKKGDVLIRINTDFLDKDLALEKARIAQTEVRIEKTLKNLERYEKLFKSEAVSEIDYDNLYFSHQELIKEKEVQGKALDKIQLQRAKCVIKAPFDGIILEKTVDAGDWVIPGGMLYRVGAADDLFVKVPVPETLLKFTNGNQRVETELTAYGRKIEGTIEGILPEADEKTKNVFVKVRPEGIHDLGLAMAENMSATVYMPASESKTLKRIPRDALVSFQGKRFVYTVKDQHAKMLPVTIVAYMGDAVGVNDPHIAAGMPVVVDGNERLRPDQPVEVMGD